ncbi:MAG: hypothetical protein IJY93_04725 [Clostridia bacterium]|nr:hypothetical protein [Clostridia bacterium]
MNYHNTNEINEIDTIEVDLFDLIRLLWQRLWVIVLSMVVCGAIAFSAAVFLVTPMYTSSAMLYVNNSSASVSGIPITISASQLSASKSLLDTYVVILKTRTTLNMVKDRTDLDYSIGEMQGMISAAAVNDTDIFRITVTCPNPEDARTLVDTLVDILPNRIADIVDGSSVRVVDTAITPTARSSPSYTRYAVIGILVGAVLSCAIIVIEDLMNTTVRDEEYLKQRYNIPILAVVPEAYSVSKKAYGYKHYYKSRYKYGYHGKYGYHRTMDENGYARSYEEAQTRGGNK